MSTRENIRLIARTPLTFYHTPRVWAGVGVKYLLPCCRNWDILTRSRLRVLHLIFRKFVPELMPSNLLQDFDSAQYLENILTDLSLNFVFMP